MSSLKLRKGSFLYPEEESDHFVFVFADEGGEQEEEPEEVAVKHDLVPSSALTIA